MVPLTLASLTPGKRVLLLATVANIHGSETQPIESQVVTVQLTDGQGVYTNVRNLFDPVLLEQPVLPGLETDIVIPEEILAIRGLEPAQQFALYQANILTLEDLKHTSNDVLASLPNFGSRHIASIRQVVEYMGEKLSTEGDTTSNTIEVDSETTSTEEETTKVESPKAIDTPSRSKAKKIDIEDEA